MFRSTCLLASLSVLFVPVLFVPVLFVPVLFVTGPALADESQKIDEPPQQQPNKNSVEFFERRIRPVLVRHCYECHSAESGESKGGLSLDTREASRQGGDSGHAIVPRNIDDSLLMSALRYEDFEMPPDQPLPERVVADFERWIKMGAPDPRHGGAQIADNEIDFEEARKFWSFQPIRRPHPPSSGDTSWPSTDLDRFVFARLESKGIEPVADAEPEVLLRRVFFDLVGLPPSPEQLRTFAANPTRRTLEAVIDELLNSPQFGERWGRHWLDVVRYGESSGMERNFLFPQAWRYRDYVIQSLNDDKPFDQFAKEQIAGDLLDVESPEQQLEQLIATGLLAIGAKSLNEPNAEQFAMDVVDDQIDVTTRAFLGITASCARCHDHKFDPIPQSEYYSLAGIFRSTETFYGTGGIRGNRRPGSLLAVGSSGVQPAGSKTDNRRGRQQVQATTKRLQAVQLRASQLRRQPKSKSLDRRLKITEAQIEKIQTQLGRLKRQQGPQSTGKQADPDAILVMGVQDFAQPEDTQLRIRGEANQRGESVPRGFLTVADTDTTPLLDSGSSGRLQYAQYIVSPDNPLTARVAVNRIWQHLFGTGIVRSVNNFGANGDKPTHPELLDYLASEFISNGWSTKKLIHSIMLSRTYQLSCNHNEHAAQVDPDNALYWRMNQRRLEAEAIRDAMLAVSGDLDLTPGQGSVVASIDGADVSRGIRPDQLTSSRTTRSIYLPIVRGYLPELLGVFDFPDPNMIFGQRDVTTVPTQALYMMNSSFVIEQSRRFANRLRSQNDLETEQRIDLAFQLALGRSPSGSELQAAVQFLDTAESEMDDEMERDEACGKAWAGLCQTLLASAEFRYLN